jgi:hypothetical protein
MAVCIFSCTQPDKARQNVTPLKDSVITSSQIDTQKIVSANTVPDNNQALFHITTLHPFSNINKEDTFSLILTGNSIYTGQIFFKIIDFNKRVIHNEKFPATDLLGDEENSISTNKEKEDTIIARMKSFFSESNFDKPAIDASDTFDPDENYDKQLWQDIKSDTSATGFLYSHGYEGTYGIAYSKKKQKAVCYFSSD